MKYALLYLQGKQYIVNSGIWLMIDYLKNIKLNHFIIFNKILFFRTETFIQIGKPFLKSFKILGKYLENIKGKKLKVFKKKIKKKYKRMYGYRSKFTKILII